MGRGGTRLRNGLAEPTEVGRVTHAEVRRPNATLVGNDVEGVVRTLKAEVGGEVAVAGPDLARSLTDLGVIDEYRIYLHPVVLGSGKPFFAGARPRLRLETSQRMDKDVIRLSYIP